MRLEDQSYLVQYPEWLKQVWHTELLWHHKQIIRLKEQFHDVLLEILWDNHAVSLYNHYNPINTDLIRLYKSNPERCNTAMTCKIIWHTDSEPILDGTSLQVVQILEMGNIWFEDILDEELKKSLAFYWQTQNGNVNVANLHKWLSEQFYGWRRSVEEIQELQKLFYRKISLPNT